MKNGLVLLIGVVIGFVGMLLGSPTAVDSKAEATWMPDTVVAPAINPYKSVPLPLPKLDEFVSSDMDKSPDCTCENCECAVTSSFVNVQQCADGSCAPQASGSCADGSCSIAPGQLFSGQRVQRIRESGLFPRLRSRFGRCR